MSSHGAHKWWYRCLANAGIVPEATLAVDEIAQFVTDHLATKMQDHSANSIADAFDAGAVEVTA